MLGTAIAVAVLLEFGNVPLDISLWIGLPYLCLLILERLFHRNAFERVVMLVLVLLATSFGFVALLDGLFLHAGLLVTTDPNVSHLVTIFVPMHQLIYCLLVAVGLLLVRLCVFLSRRHHPTTLA